MTVIDTVKEFLIKHECIEAGEVVDESESLLERGIIDSIIILKMVTFLQEKYEIEIGEDDLMPENFDSITGIDNYVRSKMS